MKLPNYQHSYISTEKLTEYLLSESHPVGRSKAKYFRELGFNEGNIRQLAKLLLTIAKINDVKNLRKSIYGTNYIVEGTIRTPTRESVKIITVWFAKTEQSKPSFVTAYPV